MAKTRNDKDLKAIEEAQQEGMLSLAEELSLRYVAAYPDDVEGSWLRAKTLYYLDRLAEAKQYLESIVPHLTEAFLGEAFYYLARICREMGNLAEAERYCIKAIETDPEDSANYVELASLYMLSNRIAEAEQLAMDGIKADASPVVDLYLFLGSLLRSKREIIKAADAFRRVLEEEDAENVELAIDDLKKTAALLGLDFASPKSTPDDEVEADTDGKEGEKEPGKLTAHIHREFFVAILKGEKKIEYRDCTEYWMKRITKAGPPPFHFRIINGMLKNSPELTVVVENVLLNFRTRQYELHLGAVLEVKNWEGGSDGCECAGHRPCRSCV